MVVTLVMLSLNPPLLPVNPITNYQLPITAVKTYN
ncbi:hypothetical protein MiSe_71110 [Microseira wollei NIES-4236]|uniref:Uncharacterized protein n=1 Tax=Microseira wollei NIES-4236 TaxID=2530354 RepID=A0AAV3XPZ3_9CYAN|nr:hypothetical protein MiSe_71110 [Microseira wollei NIES-4236]